MSLVLGFAVLLITALLAWDWLVKRRRLAARAEVTDGQFLLACRGPRETAADDQILEIRRRVARELGLPASKIQPQDELIELRDRYCLVVSGHVGLGHLFDDLGQARKPGAAEQMLAPDTVQDYIAALVGDRGTGLTPRVGER